MAVSHAKAQDLSESVFLKGRQIVLRSLSATLQQLDKLYENDAAKIQKALQDLLEKAGVPSTKVQKIITGVFSASRAERVELVGTAIRQAAITAAATDSKLAQAIFRGDRDAAVPLEKGRSSSPRRRTPWLRLVRGSEGNSAETS